MRIDLYPARHDAILTATRTGDVLTLNGTDLDFGPLPAGATLPRDAIDCGWIAGDVTRDGDGILQVPLILPYGADAPDTVRFPEPITLDGDGPVPLPGREGTPEVSP